eukprot:s1039_g30.t1
MHAEQEQAIGELEAFAVLVAFRVWSSSFTSRHLICLLDNEGSRFLILKGYSSNKVLEDIVHEIALLEEELSTLAWYASVPTEANLADFPSRLKSHPMLQGHLEVKVGDLWQILRSLSAHRLATKDLFGILIQSAEDASGVSHIRHPHPCEIQALTGVDPVLDYGPHVKLTLTALGQLASPLQSLWLFAAIAERLETLQHGMCHERPMSRWTWTMKCLLHGWKAYPEVNCDSCEVAVVIPGEAPVTFKLRTGATVAEYLAAYSDLTGSPFQAKVQLADGTDVEFSHVMQPGQTLVVHVSSLPWECGPLPRMPEMNESNVEVAFVNPVEPDRHVPPTDIDPTAAWTGPAQTGPHVPEYHRPSIFDVGEVSVSNTKTIENESWDNAAPLLALKDTQFLRLPVPSVHDTKQLWSLRHQFIQVVDRLQILQNQGDYMSDDELRFHFTHTCGMQR